MSPPGHGALDRGRERLERAEADLPMTRSVRQRFTAARTLDDVRVAVSSRLGLPAAVTIRTLTAGGATVTACASNPMAVEDDLVAVLIADDEADVHARHGQTLPEQIQDRARTLDAQPHLVVDHGADLTEALWESGRAAVGGLELMAAALPMLAAAITAGRLTWPVLDASVPNRLAGGHAAVAKVAHIAGLVADRTVAVIGFGPAAQTAARETRALGADVLVAPSGAVQAIDAAMQGHQVLPATRALPAADIVLAAVPLTTAQLALLRDTTVLVDLTRSGVGFDPEVLGPRRPHADRPGQQTYETADGRRVTVLTAENHEALDATAAGLALMVEWLWTWRAELPVAVHQPPVSVRRQLSELALASRGIRID